MKLTWKWRRMRYGIGFIPAEWGIDWPRIINEGPAHVFHWHIANTRFVIVLYGRFR